MARPSGKEQVTSGEFSSSWRTQSGSSCSPVREVYTTAFYHSPSHCPLSYMPMALPLGNSKLFGSIYISTQADTKLEITNRQESQNIQRQPGAHFTPPTWNFHTHETPWPELDAIHFPISLATLEQEGGFVILKFEEFLFRAQVKPHSVLNSSNINKRNNHHKACIYVPFKVYMLACLLI